MKGTGEMSRLRQRAKDLETYNDSAERELREANAHIKTLEANLWDRDRTIATLAYSARGDPPARNEYESVRHEWEQTIAYLRIKEARIEAPEDALRNVQELSEQTPGGCDHDADPTDPSPEDAGVHLSGLIWQICERALTGEKEIRGQDTQTP